MKKKIAVMLMFIVLVCSLMGCTEADKVSANISKEANLFNVMRRISVINMRTDTPLFELTGRFSLSNNDTNELAITVETGPNEYKKHYIYLNDWTMYVVEDISGASVSPYHYEINFLPEMIVPFEFTSDY